MNNLLFPDRTGQIVRCTIAALLSITFTCSTALGQAGTRGKVDRDRKLFLNAMIEYSSAPNYVLITVVDANTGKETRVATLPYRLRGAIALEYNLAGSREKCRCIDSIVRATRDRCFTFHSIEALKRVASTYTAEMLADIRAQLAPLSDSAVIAGLAHCGDWERKLHSIYLFKEGSGWSISEPERDALAHVLLERHIRCGVGDVVTILYVDRTPCPDADVDQGN